jgi:hypothetical protein
MKDFGRTLFCEEHPNELLVVRPEWNELIALPPEEKVSMLDFSIADIFPCRINLLGDRQ